MDIILTTLHPWIEAQISNQQELPKYKSKLIKLALQVKSTVTY